MSLAPSAGVSSALNALSAIDRCTPAPASGGASSVRPAGESTSLACRDNSRSRPGRAARPAAGAIAGSALFTVEDDDTCLPNEVGGEKLELLGEDKRVLAVATVPDWGEILTGEYGEAAGDCFYYRVRGSPRWRG